MRFAHRWIEPSPLKRKPCFVNPALFRHNGAMKDLPVCTLTAKELQERKATILTSVSRAVIKRSEIPSGYRYEFSNRPDTHQAVLQMVELERQCCRFLTFELIETAETIQLDVTGGLESLAIIGELFG